MNVHFPHGGMWIMLRWHTSREQHKIALARTECGIRAVVDVLARESPYVELKEYERIELRAPTEAMDEYATKLREQGRHRDFWDELRIAFVSLRKPMPPELQLCNRYVPLNDDDNESNDSEHYCCTNCMYRLVPVAGTPREFYEARRAAFDAFQPPHAEPGVPSRARRATSYDGLKAAVPNFGHHCTGVDLVNVTRDFESGPHGLYYRDRPLFLYRTHTVLDKDLLNERLAKAREDDRERSHVADRARERAARAQAEEYHRRLLALVRNA